MLSKQRWWYRRKERRVLEKQHCRMISRGIINNFKVFSKKSDSRTEIFEVLLKIV